MHQIIRYPSTPSSTAFSNAQIDDVPHHPQMKFGGIEVDGTDESPYIVIINPIHYLDTKSAHAYNPKDGSYKFSCDDLLYDFRTLAMFVLSYQDQDFLAACINQALEVAMQDDETLVPDGYAQQKFAQLKI